MNRDHLLFNDPATATAWAFIRQLSPATQHLLLARLREHLAVVETASSAASSREATAVRALHEALAILHEEGADDAGEPRHLSLDTYRRLRTANPTAGWPADATLRRWLVGGGSWNDALRRARIAAVPDGDRLVVSRRRDFTAEQALAALKLCTREIGEVPGLWQYIAWAGREGHYGNPDIPGSQQPFYRLFGGWAESLHEADLLLIDGKGPTSRVEAVAAANAAGYVPPAGYAYPPEAFSSAVIACAETFGRSPRMHEFVSWRRDQQQEAITKGRPVPAIPGATTLLRRFGTWDEALAGAGLAALGGRATASNPDRVRRGGSKPRWNDYEVVLVLDRAATECVALVGDDAAAALAACPVLPRAARD